MSLSILSLPLRGHLPHRVLMHSVEGIAQQVEQHPADLLRDDLKLTHSFTERPLDLHLQPRYLRSFAVISQIDVFANQRIDIR